MTTSSLYCFPDLSHKDGRAAARSESLKPSFQRLALGSARGACRPRSAGAVANFWVDKTSAQVEEIEQAAYCRGFSDGEKKGFEQGERTGGEAAMKQLETLLQGLRQLLAELEGLRGREAHAFEKELVDLTLDVARKVVGREVAAGPDVVAHLLREGLSRLEHAGPLTIRMNPGDLEQLASVRPQWLKGLADPGRIRFEADPSLSVGGCFIESEAGDIDARVEQRFRVVAEALQDEASMPVAAREKGL